MEFLTAPITLHQRSPVLQPQPVFQPQVVAPTLWERVRAMLGERIPRLSMRERPYAVCPFVAEFWCTVSNAAFFAVALYNRSWTVFLAGAASTLSHAIPLRVLHHLDMLAVGAVALRLAMHHRALVAHPPLLALGALAVGVNLLDTYLSRPHFDRVAPIPHVMWHCTAALFLHRVCAVIRL